MGHKSSNESQQSESKSNCKKVHCKKHGCTKPDCEKVKCKKRKSLIPYIAKTVTKIEQMQKSSIVILQRDVGRRGYVIDKPGQYCLGEDIVFKPKAPKGTAKVTISDPTGSGAKTIAIVSSGKVIYVAVVKGGSNYTNPTATVSGYGSGAVVVPLFSGVSGFTITNPGGGYVQASTTAVITGDGTGATVAVNITPLGTVFSFLITNPGSGYTTATITISAPTIAPFIQATATVQIAAGQIVGFNIINGGVGYTDTVQAAITIRASNVNLLLNNHTLSQFGVSQEGNVSPKQYPYVVGINVPDVIPSSTDINAVGLESIYINGDQGIINGFSMMGISIFAHVKDIRLNNITVKNIAKLGTLANRPFPAYQAFYGGYFQTIHPQPGIQSPPLLFAAIRIGESNYFGLGNEFFTQQAVVQNRVSDVIMNNVSCIDNFCTGFVIANATNTAIDMCHFDETFSDDPNSLTIGAILGPDVNDVEFPTLVNLVMRNSTCNSTQMRGDYTTEAFWTFNCVGAFHARSFNIKFNDCQFNNSSCTFAGDANLSTCAGMVNAGIYDVTWTDCNFDNISSVFSTEACHISGHGLLSNDPVDEDTEIKSSRNVRFIRCTADNATQNGQLQLPVPVYTFPIDPCLVGGFLMYYCKNLSFEKCMVRNAVCNGPVLPYNSATVGWYVAGGGDVQPAEFETDNVTLKGCIAAKCTAVNGGSCAGYAIVDYRDAITSYNLRSVVFEDCISEDNQSLIPTFTNISPPPVQGIGIGFSSLRLFAADSPLPFSFKGCQALRNKGIPSFDASAEGLGIGYSAGFFATGVPFTIPPFPPFPFPLERHEYEDCLAIDNVYGFLIECCQQFVFRNCRADLNVASTTGNPAIDGIVGEGFTDLGFVAVGGTKQSFSLFQKNSAFANGAGSTHIGTNGNYNVYYGTTLDPVPTLNGSVSTASGAEGGYYFPQHATYAPVHNISIIE